MEIIQLPSRAGYGQLGDPWIWHLMSFIGNVVGVIAGRCRAWGRPCIYGCFLTFNL